MRGNTPSFLSENDIGSQAPTDMDVGSSESNPLSRNMPALRIALGRGGLPDLGDYSSVGLKAFGDQGR